MEWAQLVLVLVVLQSITTSPCCHTEQLRKIRSPLSSHLLSIIYAIRVTVGRGPAKYHQNTPLDMYATANQGGLSSTSETTSGSSLVSSPTVASATHATMIQCLLRRHPCQIHSISLCGILACIPSVEVALV
ncbi:unnamed protein product [Musa acuminata subsp. malaccensis]|uniref:(wild Malaysian banana) hypothetical protein n=1 Tax=Musa acuminata subsp. malaccensis TaxID=214687 RepID=A0A8D7A3D0_MUSAM|nr:unnamed protein product [Musa acuminata subsp. malaccensis]